VDGKLYGNTSLGIGALSDSLYQIDLATENSTLIGRFPFDNIYALNFDQTGRLSGISDVNDELISIDTFTGNGSLIAAIGLSFGFDMASQPKDNTMFVSDTGTHSLYTINARPVRQRWSVRTVQVLTWWALPSLRYPRRRRLAPWLVGSGLPAWWDFDVD